MVVVDGDGGADSDDGVEIRSREDGSGGVVGWWSW